MIKKIVEFDLFELFVQKMSSTQIESFSAQNIQKIYTKSLFLLTLML